MPKRKVEFLNNNYYHVYNKTIDHINIFDKEIYAKYFLELAKYYNSSTSLIPFSRFLTIKDEKIKSIYFNNLLPLKVDVLAYCFMPNHFHFLLKQKTDDGINKFISNILNSITRYHNLIEKRKGPIFLPNFKAKLITSTEILLHVARYINLNPYSSGLISKIENLQDFKFCSYREYLDNESLCSTREILDMFANKEQFIKFNLNQAEYQKNLDILKHLEER